MTTLKANDGTLVLINTFTVEPDRADELLKVLADATEQVIRKMPGFISANLHLATDRKHVTNYAQWRSQADMDAMLKSPEAAPHMKQANDIASSNDPITYELRESVSI